MRLTASTLSDDHLLLVLATAEADAFCKAPPTGAYAGVTIFALTPPTTRWQYGQRHAAARECAGCALCPAAAG
jgi:hypothetical protein